MKRLAPSTVALALFFGFATTNTQAQDTTSNQEQEAPATESTTTTPATEASSPSPRQDAPPGMAPSRTAPTRTRTRPAPQRAEEPSPPPDDDLEEEDGDSWGIFYLRLQGGLSYSNLLQFSQENFIPEAEEMKGVGGYGGLAVGFRVFWFSFGANATFARHDFDLGTVGAEVAFHVPTPFAQPYIRAGIGYAWLGSFDFGTRSLNETDIYGLATEVGAGIDIKVARALSIGAGIDAAFLNLTRQPLGDTNITGIELEEDGDAVGFQLRAHAHITLHL